MAAPKKIGLNDSNSKQIIDLLRSLGIDMVKEKTVILSVHDNSLVISHPDDWDLVKVTADSRSFAFWDNPEDSIYDEM